MPEPVVSPAVDESAVVAALVRRVPEWLREPEPGSVRIDAVQRRAQSVLFDAEIRAGGSRESVVVKIPLPPGPRADSGFRLFEPVGDPAQKSRFEYAALVAVDEVVSASGDERFGSARAFGHIPELAAVVVAVVPGRTLDEVIRRGRRSGPGDEHQLDVMARSGALLSLFHSASTDHMVRRDTTADEVVADINDLVRHVVAAGRAGRLAHRLQLLVERIGEPSGWPAGAVMGHGDFAPRNIFVDDRRVTVIDSLGRFQVPPHEDMAYLLVELSTGMTRFKPPGLPWSADWAGRMRCSLLEGYPMADDVVLAVFELRALLDKWRSLSDRAGRHRSRRAALSDRGREFLIEREVARVARRLEREL